MHRWTAKLLVLVMFVPALGPLAMARTSVSMGPHCPRQAAKPVMECHPGMTMAMAMPPESQPSDASVRAVDSCCQDHACCRGLATPRSAKAAGQLPRQPILTAETALPALDASFVPAPLPDSDSARAPPRA